MLLIINLEDWKKINVSVIKNEKVLYNQRCKGYTDLVKKIHWVSCHFKIDKYTIVKFDKNITVVMNDIFDFKKDLKMLMGDIRIVRKPFMKNI